MLTKVPRLEVFTNFLGLLYQFANMERSDDKRETERKRLRQRQREKADKEATLIS
jgi:hypothetical protein